MFKALTILACLVLLALGAVGAEAVYQLAATQAAAGLLCLVHLQERRGLHQSGKPGLWPGLRAAVHRRSEV
jgi:hypothetical protein